MWHTQVSALQTPFWSSLPYVNRQRPQSNTLGAAATLRWVGVEIHWNHAIYIQLNIMPRLCNPLHSKRQTQLGQHSNVKLQPITPSTSRVNWNNGTSRVNWNNGTSRVNWNNGTSRVNWNNGTSWVNWNNGTSRVNWNNGTTTLCSNFLVLLKPFSMNWDCRKTPLVVLKKKKDFNILIDFSLHTSNF